MDEATRRSLHSRLAEVLGPEHAVAMMTAYPPFDWPQVATKSDLRELKLEVDATIHRAVDEAITSQTRTVLLGLLGTVMATGATVVGATALLT